jgi:hypothetical protein
MARTKVAFDGTCTSIARRRNVTSRAVSARYHATMFLTQQAFLVERSFPHPRFYQFKDCSIIIVIDIIKLV